MNIYKVNGQGLERGDLPEEIPGIMTRKFLRMKPGEKVKLTVIADPSQADELSQRDRSDARRSSEALESRRAVLRG